METVKVDLEKLQLLNDRIAQAIEALNQVRMTTHGLQHSTGPWGQQPFGGQQIGGLGAGIYGQSAGQPFGTQATGVPGQGVPQIGLQHSYSQQPQTMPFSTYGQSVPFVSPMAGLGISHTTPQAAQLGQVGRAAMADPAWTQRVAHTFPFVTSPFPPTIG